MALHRIRKGLDVPLSGAPEAGIHDGPEIFRVAVMGDDTPGVRARMAVEEGDTVRRGDLLFEDRTRPGVRYTAPGAGRVAGIFRGHRRMLRSVVIQLSEAERAGSPTDAEFVPFESMRVGEPDVWSGEEIRALLVESGLWRALRTRPFSRVPEPGSKPDALFITAIDTNPHAPDPNDVIAESPGEFSLGVRLLSKVCPEPYLCVAEGAPFAESLDAQARVEHWRGPHPAGNPGVHIHHLAPVSRHRTAWHIGYQDVIDIGRLFTTGRLPVERIITLAGPVVKRPRLLRTRLGASIEELTAGEIEEDPRGVRLISGSVLSGKKAGGSEYGFLGRYHSQVSALAEGNDRRMMGWAGPGFEDFSILNVFLSKIVKLGGTFDLTTDTNGSHRALMPIGTYERVLPMDILATYLLRSIVVGDTEQAESLGVLELDEEDLALCTFVCPGKTEFGPYLRQNLERIEKDG